MNLKVIALSAIAIVALIAGAQFWITHPQLGRGMAPLVGVAGMAAMVYGARKNSK